MENNQQLELIYSLFNQYIFQEAKNEITNVKYYFDTNPATSGNRLVELMLGAIKDYTLDAIDLPLFQSILGRTGKNPVESQEILRKIIEYKQYSKEQMAPMKKYLRDLVANVYIRKANNMYSDSPSDYLQFLKKFEFKSGDQDYLAAQNFGRINIDEVVADSNADYVPSSYPWINSLFQPECALEFGQIINIVMPSGVGKSLFAMNEALHYASMGYKTSYLALGDLNVKDFIVRMGAIYSGMEFGDVKRNLSGVYKGLQSVVKDNLDLTIAPAGVVTVDEYVDWALSKDHRILFIDYDANFATPPGESLYETYGYVYDTLTKLTAAGKLVYVLCQPKIGVFNDESIELGSLSDSSRKVHTADMIITRGRYTQGSMTNLGIFKVVKNRRGAEGDQFPSIRLSNGKFIAIPPQVYNDLKMLPEKKNFSEQDIQIMIQNFESTRRNVVNQVNQQVQQQMRGGYNPPSGPRPF